MLITNLILVIIISFIIFTVLHFRKKSKAKELLDTIVQIEGSLNSHSLETKAKQFINSGYPLNEQGPRGFTPLILASITSYEVTKLLLSKKKVKIEKKADCGGTAVHYAAGHGNIDTLKLLIEAGAKFDEPRNDGSTPIALASFKPGSQYTEVVKLLIDKNVDIDRIVAIDKISGTILMGAALSGDKERVKYILSRSALNINRKDANGLTALGHAERNNHKAIAELLRQHGASDLGSQKYDDGIRILS